MICPHDSALYEGALVGTEVGWPLGDMLGWLDGWVLGIEEGAVLGIELGWPVGAADAASTLRYNDERANKAKIRVNFIALNAS